MSTHEKLNMGVIGAGNIGNVHMRGLGAVDEAAVVGVTDVYQPLAKARAEEYGIPRVYETADELIADKGIDAVVVAVPNKHHAPLAVKALEAGKDVIVEKPMAIDADSARSIVRAQKSSGRILLVPHQMRWDWVARSVKEQAEKGALGRIYNAKAGWFRRKGIPGWGTWFTRASESGGGPLIDIGVHLLDLSLYLMGNPKPVSVYGSTYAEFGPKRRGIGSWGTPNWSGTYDVEDLATALIKMEDGSTLSLEVSWAVNGEIEENGPFIHLMGSDAGATVRGRRGKLYVEQFERPMEVALDTPGNAEDARQLMYRHFIECVRERKEPISSAMTGFTNNLILEAIYRSSKTGEAVKLDWEI